MRIAVIVLLLCGAALRFYRLDHYPLPMHQDELSNAYDAYSIVETGSDRAGERLPFVLRAAGRVDYRPALYAWLAAVPIKLSGFSATAGRVPAAVLGVISLGILFLFASALVNQTFGLLALVFATFSPWHITYSRLAHEGAMLPGFFVILVLWLWHRAAVRNYPMGHMLLIGLSLGLSSSAYQSTRLIAPLLMVLIAVDVARFSGRRWQSVGVLILASAIGALPQLYVMVTAPEIFFSRLVATTSARQDTSVVLDTLVNGFRLVLDPKILFWPDMADTGYLAVRLLPIELPFYYLGLVMFHRLHPFKLPRFRWYVYATFFLAILPALLTAHSASIRVSAALLLLPLWTATGVFWTATHIRRLGVKPWTVYAGLGAGIVASIGFVSFMYFGSLRANGQRSNNVLVQVGERLRTLGVPYDKVYVVDSPFYAAVHVAAFSGMHPAEFQRTRKVTVDAKGWDYITSVGKYRFLKPRELAGAVRAFCDSADRELFVTRGKIEGMIPIDSVAWVTDKYFFTDPSPYSAQYCSR